MKLTRHNGRSGRHGAYNPRHNDRRFDLENSEHIDQERVKQNVYWDCYQGFHFPIDQKQEDRIVYSFEQIERAFYSEHYGDFCEAQHERNRKAGHSNRDRSTEDLWRDKKTCPEESLIQIGTMEKSVSPAVLAEIAAEFFEEFERRFGDHIHILDWSLHLDEATPHIHERHVFDCENRYGEIAPQQEKALEALGFELPYPDQKPGKMNNRKKTFDAACREMLFDICRNHGLHLDHEPEYGGRTYLEKQDYILMKQKEKLAVQDQQIESKEAELEEIIIRIEDTEAFVEEVTDAAYEQAVEIVTRTVQEEIRNEDFDIIEEQRRIVLNNAELSEREHNLADRIFRGLMNRFKGMTHHITNKLAVILRSPERKAEIKEPIKESIRDRLARSQKQADELNAKRRAGRSMPPKRRQQDMELF
ncbi:MAG: serine/arginine repetitive matrix protein 2 [Oscillospiraceae bacterium]|nr:serine/arginine repetitive matrix protein 2 [Oscillospiraceae bacterium]